MVIYNGPMGESIENPTEDYIKDIFFNKGEDYWKQGSGDSCFEVEGCEEWLIFFYDESYGFMLIRHPDYLVPIDRSVNIETVEHYIGGEPMALPTCSYVSRESAYKIAQEFIVTGKFSEMVEWIDLYDIEFEHDFY